MAACSLYSFIDLERNSLATIPHILLTLVEFALDVSFLHNGDFAYGTIKLQQQAERLLCNHRCIDLRFEFLSSFLVLLSGV